MVSSRIYVPVADGDLVAFSESASLSARRIVSAYILSA
jgi:hypothetical protein